MRDRPRFSKTALMPSTTRSWTVVSRIASVRSVQDFVAVQSDLARDNLKHVIVINKRIAEKSLRIADEAGRIMQAEADRNASRGPRAMRFAAAVPCGGWAGASFDGMPGGRRLLRRPMWAAARAG
jgi:hypothetical protein